MKAVWAGHRGSVLVYVDEAGADRSSRCPGEPLAATVQGLWPCVVGCHTGELYYRACNIPFTTGFIDHDNDTY